ncbi:glycoside hydrolase family 127 protein [Trueperella sp. LYQ143]|uniref:glycoside hydrolase family 127 protein n=1 Tax=Trueperella sp. LYQ143 TaxID=3391059 RepID=UPI003983D805
MSAQPVLAPQQQDDSVRESIVAPVVPRVPTVFQPVSVRDVEISGGFWKYMQDRNHEVTIPHIYHWIHEFGTMSNFDAVAAGSDTTEHIGREFADSDAYKVLEAILWEAHRADSEKLRNQARALVERIWPAVDADGYLHTLYGHGGQAPRYSNLEWGHELYCAGHLAQAGVAAARTAAGCACIAEADADLCSSDLEGCDPGESDPTGTWQLATRIADHAVHHFLHEDTRSVGGHPVVETALAEMYRVSGREEYLRLAKDLIDRRGRGTLRPIEFGQSYFQDETPVRDMEVLEGHAVRALYLAAGAIDVAVETGDDELLAIIEKQFKRTWERRTYITGGMGSHHQDEAFGADWELPPDRAYCESCAGVAAIMVAWRLMLATGDMSYGDVIERVLFNIIPTAISESGDRFFYTNTLHQREPITPDDNGGVSVRALTKGRSEWFEVSCCPPNLARTIAQLGCYTVTHREDEVQIHQYAAGTYTLHTDAGLVRLAVETNYPKESRVRVRVIQAQRPVNIRIRVPHWADNARGYVLRGVGLDSSVGEMLLSDSEAGQPLAGCSSWLCEGMAVGDVIDMDMAIRPRLSVADPRVDAVRGCYAVEYGPMVMCLESVDQDPRYDFASLRIDPGSELRVSDSGEAVCAAGYAVNTSTHQWPYCTTGASLQTGQRDQQLADEKAREQSRYQRVDLRFIPYYQWGNRGAATMRIWVPGDQE